MPTALQFIQQVDDVRYRITRGAVPNMNVEGMFYVNDALKELVFEELDKSGGHAQSGHGAHGGEREVSHPR